MVKSYLYVRLPEDCPVISPRLTFSRKYEHSKTFGIVASAASNIIWAPVENVDNPALRSAGGGRAVVAAGEEVLCWDIKKGELIGRWKDSDCVAEVTTIAQSKSDPDIHAVG